MHTILDDFECRPDRTIEKPCLTSTFLAIGFLLTHSQKINTGFIDQLSITRRRYGNCIPLQTKCSSQQSALFFIPLQAQV